MSRRTDNVLFLVAGVVTALGILSLLGRARRWPKPPPVEAPIADAAVAR